jgi:hypothetical protein
MKKNKAKAERMGTKPKSFRISKVCQEKSLVEIGNAFSKALDRLDGSEKHLCDVPQFTHQLRRGWTKLTVYVSSVG